MFFTYIIIYIHVFLGLDPSNLWSHNKKYVGDHRLLAHAAKRTSSKEVMQKRHADTSSIAVSVPCVS